EAWDNCKFEIAEKCKQISIEESRIKRKERSFVQKEIEFLHHRLALSPTSLFLKNELNQKIKVLKSLESREIRAKLHKMHYNEINTDRHSLLTAKQAHQLVVD